MRTVYMTMEGLPEYEGNSYVNWWGEGEGESLLEVCRDVIRRDKGKAQDFTFDEQGHCYCWGMPLHFIEKVFV